MRFLFFICSTTVLIGLVCLIRTVCRKRLSPQVIYLLWLPVLIRFLLPVNISLAMPERMERLIQTPYRWMEQTVQHAIPQKYTEVTDRFDVQGQSAARQTAEPEGDKATNHVFAVGTDILAGIWLLGSMFFGIGAAVSNGKLFRYMKRNRKQCVRLKDILPDCGADLPVIVCDGVASPCLVGVFRPCILVGSDVMGQPVLLYYSLLHEMTHYRHWDPVWTFLRVLVCIVYWWNPLVWLASGLARQDCELACDSSVIAGWGTEKKKQYVIALLQLSARNRRHTDGICIAMGIAAGSESLKRRIKGIMCETKTKQYVLLPAALVMAVVFLAGCGGKTNGNQIEDNTTVNERIEKDETAAAEQEKTEEDGCLRITLDDGKIVVLTSEDMSGVYIYIASENGGRQYECVATESGMIDLNDHTPVF